MASFGEALVSAFSSTYGSVSRGMLQQAQARAIQDELEATSRFRNDTTRAQQARGIANPDGTARSLVNAGATGTDLAAAGGAPAAAPLAPPPAAAPVAADAGATSADVAGVTPTPRSLAPAAAGAASAPPAAPPAGPPNAGQSALQRAGQQRPDPEAQVREIGAQVGNDPVAAMIAGGTILPRQEGEPTPQQAVQMAPNLLREVQDYARSREGGAERLRENRGVPTRPDWDGYLQDVILSAQRNLSPQQQVQALAGVDRIRQAGLQRFGALAVAASQAGDMQGAARALTGASAYNPDGFRDTFTPTENGITLTRQREDGSGQPQTINVPAQQVAQYTMRILDPSWSLTHELSTRRQAETERHNQATEGISRASLASAAADRADRAADRADRRSEREAGASYARAAIEEGRAEDALARLPADAPAERRAELEARRDRAREARENAMPNADVRGLQVGEAAAGARESRRTREEQARATREGRAPLSEAETRTYNEAAAEVRARAEGRNAANPESDRRALSLGRPFFQANRDQDPAVILDTLSRANRPGTNLRVQDGFLTDPENGIRLRVPPNILQRPPASPGGGTDAPPAPRDEGTRSPSGRATSLRSAEEGAAAPAPAPSLGGSIPGPLLSRGQSALQDRDPDLAARPARRQFEERVSRRAAELRQAEGLEARPTARTRAEWNRRNDEIIRRAAEDVLQGIGRR